MPSIFISLSGFLRKIHAYIIHFDQVYPISFFPIIPPLLLYRFSLLTPYALFKKRTFNPFNIIYARMAVGPFTGTWLRKLILSLSQQLSTAHRSSNGRRTLLGSITFHTEIFAGLILLRSYACTVSLCMQPWKLAIREEAFPVDLRQTALRPLLKA